VKNSLIQQTSLTCPICDNTFESEIWFIIDTNEKPDLIEKALVGTLNTLICPQCGNQVSIDAPLLIYLAGQEPRLVFSPSQSTSQDEDQQQAYSLLEMIHQTLGELWQSDMVDKMMIVPRNLLSVALSQDPQTALKQILEQKSADLERFREEFPEEYNLADEISDQLIQDRFFLSAFRNFVETETWNDSQQYLEQHPELLSDQAVNFLAKLIEKVRAQEDKEFLSLLEEHYALIERCRKIGIDSAFSEKIQPQGLPQIVREFFYAKTWEESRIIVEQHPELLDPETDKFLDHLKEIIQSEKSDETLNFIEEHLSLLRRCREIGIQQAFVEKEPNAESLSLALVLQEFIEANTWSESKQILENHPELLSDDAENLLIKTIDANRIQGSQNIIDLFEEHLSILRESRVLGVNVVFALQYGIGDRWEEIGKFMEEATRQALDAENRYRQGEKSALEQAVLAWERILKHQFFCLGPDNFRSAAFSNSGGIYLFRYWEKGVYEDLTQAIDLLERAVDLTLKDSPDLPSRLTKLGTSLRDRFVYGSDPQDIDKAIQTQRQAISFSSVDSPVLPIYYGNLGTALATRYTYRADLEDLDNAINAFQKASDLATSDTPEIPSFLNNTSIALRDRYERIGNISDLEQALIVCKQAISRLPLESHSMPKCLQNLGNILRDRYMAK